MAKTVRNISKRLENLSTSNLLILTLKKGVFETPRTLMINVLKTLYCYSHSIVAGEAYQTHRSKLY